MKSGRRSKLDSWIAGSAPGIAAGDPSPTREGEVPAPFARFASNPCTTVPNRIVFPTLARGARIACGDLPAPLDRQPGRRANLLHEPWGQETSVPSQKSPDKGEEPRHENRLRRFPHRRWQRSVVLCKGISESRHQAGFSQRRESTTDVLWRKLSACSVEPRLDALSRPVKEACGVAETHEHFAWYPWGQVCQSAVRQADARLAASREPALRFSSAAEELFHQSSPR